MYWKLVTLISLIFLLLEGNALGVGNEGVIKQVERRQDLEDQKFLSRWIFFDQTVANVSFCPQGVCNSGTKVPTTNREKLVRDQGNIESVPRYPLHSALNLPSQPLTNGQILQITGDVQIQRSGRRIEPQIGTDIYPEDQLSIANASEVILQCADLSSQTLSSGNNRLNPCPTATEQTECTPGTYNCPHRGDIAWNNRIPYIITPRRTAILTDKPLLHWNGLPDANSYTVTLEGDGIEWTTQVSDTQITYPGEPPLQPGGDYLLIIEADTGESSLDESPLPGGLNFSRLDEQQAQQIRTQATQITQQPWNQTAKALALATLYSKHQLHTQAIASLESLIADGVESAAIYRKIGDRYFYHLALPPQAKPYYKKAIELSHTTDIEEKTHAQYHLGRIETALGNHDEAMHWFTLALQGYQTLGYSEQIQNLEHQLNR
ncbi:MAG: tetratricopeptide repeat protein [Coleofasciculus sp. B1-GNL1-01]|uniref:tetratricopeptide repeat protein n=1 Tax=Coleofasciculus sp. B1-GNL1-01 TaxID=3068484 RepID=UPI0032F5BF72